MVTNMKIYEIAKRCGYECVGKDMDVSSISYSETAKENDIAIAWSKQDIEQTAAKAVITLPTLMPSNKTLIFVDEPIENAAIKVAKLLAEAGNVKCYSYTEYICKGGYYEGSNVIMGKNTIISPNVYIDDDVVIGDNCFIEPNVHIKGGSVIGDYVRIASGAVIGADGFYHYYDETLKSFCGIGRAVIGDYAEIGSNTVIARGIFSDTIIGRDSKIGNMVEIGHDVKIGSNCKIVSQSGIASKAVIGDCVYIFGQCGIANNLKIGDNVTVMGKSMVTKDIDKNKVVSGFYAREHREELKTLTKIRKL